MDGTTHQEESLTSDNHPRYPPKPPWALWDDERLAEEGKEFEKLIHLQRGSAETSSGATKVTEDRYATWDNAPNSKCYASFGDKGTTASAGAFGHLMQISQYLKSGRSGMFALVHRKMEEPRWPVYRAQDLEAMSHRPSTKWQGLSMGLELKIRGLRSKKRQPQLKWVNWRWPRFEYDLPNRKLKISVQWMVHDHIVLQQWVVKNEGDQEVEVPFQLGTDMWIQDLEYVDYENNYNDRRGEQGQWGTAGPRGYSWVLLHPFDEPMSKATSTSENEWMTLSKAGPTPTTIVKRESACENFACDSGSTTATRQQVVNVKKKDVAAAIMSVFVDGSARQFEGPGGGSWVGKVNGNDTLDMTVAYKLILVPEDKIDYKNFLIPATAANVSEFIMRETPMMPYSLSGLDFGENDIAKRHGDQINSQKRNGSFGNVEISPENIVTHGVADSVDTSGLVEAREIFRPSGCPSVSGPRNHIDFAVWRNLEYILSVCCIPLKAPSLFDPDAKRNPIGAEEMVATALTCGDISGHRIYNPASYFAFEFLMNITKRLDQIKAKLDQHRNATKFNELVELQRRIEKVCNGHIVWLLSKAEISEIRCLRGDHYVTGKAVNSTESSLDLDSADSFVPIDTLTDNPFHIIKAFDVAKYYKTDIAVDFLKKLSSPWLSMLGKADKRGKFAWPHRRTDETNIFRLDDHVWIWRALTSLEEAGVWKEEHRSLSMRTGNVQVNEGLEEDDEDEEADDSTDDATTQAENEMERLIKTYTPREVQKGTLQRFTTVENDIARKRMLAVTRSTQQTRFLFHARDTSLLYGVECGYFSPDIEMWQNTLEAQRLHSDNEETTWDNAIRYALGLIMGTKDFSIGGLESNGLVTRAVDVLFGSSSPNGFFPGQLDDTTQRPTLFHRERFRDHYFHASFEIPFVLLTYANQACERYNSKTFNAPPIVLSPAPNADGLFTQFERGPQTMPSIDSRTGEVRAVTAARQSTGMKKSVPFGSRVDQRSIVELTDEWLYNYPAFLDSDIKIQSVNDTGPNESIGEVLDRASAFKRPIDYNLLVQGAAMVVDTGQKKRSRQREADDNSLPVDILMDNGQLEEFLSQPRIPIKAKKRFIWLPQADPLTALICYNASPDVSKQPMSLFFDRHSKYVNYFHDNPTRVGNTWETEIHVSFYMLITAHPSRNHSRIPVPSQADFPGSSDKSTGASISEKGAHHSAFSSTQIARASFGFRFDGDFFDRYWTCHFIENDPRPFGWRWDLPFDIQSKAAKGKSWRQRKVLELHLCDRILTLMLKGSEAILEEARQVLHVKPGFLAYTVDNDDEFKHRNELWESIQPILRTVHDELSAAYNTLSKWARREADREAERPRWTRNDERKYRGIINKLTGSTSRKIADVERVLNRIDSLEKFLDSYFDKTRTRLSNDNMLTFTYVTVIFLPLGFAASIFSMGGAPDRDLVISMTICAIVAFLLTMLVLINAKRLLGMLNWMFIRRLEALGDTVNKALKHLETQSRDKMHSSRMFQSYKERHHNPDNTDKNRRSLPVPGLESAPKTGRRSKVIQEGTSLHWLFWPIFILVEIPARSVLRACHALRHQDTTWETIPHVCLGFTFLPLFIFSWLGQVCFYNIMDLSRLGLGTLHLIYSRRSTSQDSRTAEAAAPPKREDEEAPEGPLQQNVKTEAESTAMQMSKLTYPLDSWRPLRRFSCKERGMATWGPGADKEEGRSVGEGVHEDGVGNPIFNFR